MTDRYTATTGRDLTTIAHLADSHALLTQAVHQAGARLPGGQAMETLAPVASMEAWENLTQASERHPGREWTAPDLEDDQDRWPPLQLLRYWSEQWRAHSGEPVDHPTLSSEATYLHTQLDDARARLAPREWDTFAADVATAKRRLEDVLATGDRVQRGAPCHACPGQQYLRKLQPYRLDDGTRAWRHSDWHCPGCRTRLTGPQYDAMIAAAAYDEQRADVYAGTTLPPVVEDVWVSWATVGYAAEATGRMENTIRQWVSRGQVAAGCLLEGRRTGYVSLDDVWTQHDRAAVRKPRAS